MPKKKGRKVKKAVGKAMKMNGRATVKMIGFKRNGNISKRKAKSRKKK
jgi:hypothetical protein